MHIIAKQLARRRARVEIGRRIVSRSSAAIAKLQSLCTHSWKLHSLYAKPCDEGHAPPKSWVHTTCAVCDSSTSKLCDAPVCDVCLQPMMDGRHDQRAAEARELAKKADPYAGRIYIFKCVPCNTVSGIPTRIEEKKR